MEQRLTLIEDRVGKASDGHILARYACSCGGTIVTGKSRVKNGYTRSCGCLIKEMSHNTTHGMRYSPEYSSWQAMKVRCLAPSNKDYPRWGAKGITVSPEWIDSFEAFFAHIGPRPSTKHSIDRIDNKRGYEPGNVRWATRQEQQRNRGTAYRWRIKGLDFETAHEAAAYFEVSEVSVHRWVKGYFDKRRNTLTPPREDCHATPRY